MKNSQFPLSAAKITILALILAAFAMRVWRLDSVPPGWRDDELIDSLVISQKAIDGVWTIYYADASGHEPLYHNINGFFLAVFGPSIFGIRYISVFLGTLTIALTYSLGQRLLGHSAGLIAATALAASFWSLMYSRFGLRHIFLPVSAIPAFYFFWRGLFSKPLSVSSQQSPMAKCWSLLPKHWLFAALFTGIGFYIYFASRGMPLILLAFVGYVWLGQRPLLRGRWAGILLFFGLIGLLALPLAITLRQQPELEGRVSELAVPLVAARAGNFAPIADHIRITLSMFHRTGDGEWLYNIPDRPVFGAVGAVFFWLGVVIALYQALRPLAPWRHGSQQTTPRIALVCALLLLWWLAGISPAFLSVPPASFSHTILAQTAVFLIAVLPIWQAQQMLPGRLARYLPAALGLLLVATIAWRDWPAYFQEWPQRGMVRFLYRADIYDVARYLDDHPELTDFSIGGLLAGPWDKLALAANLADPPDGFWPTAVRPRWYNPQRAIILNPPLSFSGYLDENSPYAAAYTFLEDVPGGYDLNQVTQPLGNPQARCFTNGLCVLTAVYNPTTQRLDLAWEVQQPLQLPPMPLISNPPPPGVYAGPRLHVFAQLQDANEQFLVGDDGLWVDPTTLQVGDIFIQQHWLVAPEGREAVTAVFGLYDPKTGQRILTKEGHDLIRLK